VIFAVVMVAFLARIACAQIVPPQARYRAQIVLLPARYNVINAIMG
jgi:hypothetical protein